MVDLPRRSLLAGIAALGAGACSKINESETTRSLIGAAFLHAGEGEETQHRKLLRAGQKRGTGIGCARRYRQQAKRDGYISRPHSLAYVGI